MVSSAPYRAPSGPWSPAAAQPPAGKLILLRRPGPGPYPAPKGGGPMGTFFADALLAAPQRPDRREPVRLLVDSGSTYTWVAAAVLRAVSVVPTERRRVVTIEGQVAERDAAEVLITLEGRTLHTVCLFGDAGDLD